MQEKSKQNVSPLAEVELRVLEEGREWTRLRLQEEMQKLADAGDFSPSGTLSEGSDDLSDDERRRG